MWDTKPRDKIYSCMQAQHVGVKPNIEHRSDTLDSSHLASQNGTRSYNRDQRRQYQSQLCYLHEIAGRRNTASPQATEVTHADTPHHRRHRHSPPHPRLRREKKGRETTTDNARNGRRSRTSWGWNVRNSHPDPRSPRCLREDKCNAFRGCMCL